MGEVASLRGDIPPGEVNADLVEALDGLLERARRGEITSLAWAGYTSSANDTIISGWEGVGGAQFPLMASISVLFHRFATATVEV